MNKTVSSRGEGKKSGKKSGSVDVEEVKKIIIQAISPYYKFTSAKWGNLNELTISEAAQKIMSLFGS